MKILTIVGARPQFIKAATVSRRLKGKGFEALKEKIVHTGQHYDHNLSRAFFHELEIPDPAYNLEVGSGSHGEQIGRMLMGLETVLESETPDLVLVYGDTNSTLAGALVASKAAVPLTHVEAGLRSFRRGMPEEINRVVTDRLSKLLFAPTDLAVEHLKREGIVDGVFQVGDVMYDNFLFFRDKTNPADTLARFSLTPGAYLLATVHRAENTDDPLRLIPILEGLDRISKDIRVIFPMHPRTRNRMASSGIPAPENLTTIDPVPYRQMLGLLMASASVVTDSGGLQKEAYFASVPCVTLRDETEWVETVKTGWNRLVSPHRAGARGLQEAIGSALDFPRNLPQPRYYGDGDAAGRILSLLSREP